MKLNKLEIEVSKTGRLIKNLPTEHINYTWSLFDSLPNPRAFGTIKYRLMRYNRLGYTAAPFEVAFLRISAATYKENKTVNYPSDRERSNLDIKSSDRDDVRSFRSEGI